MKQEMEKTKVRENRGLSDLFMRDLKNGLLSLLLSFVKNDSTLCLQIRNDYVNVYYRGGNIVKICQPKRNKSEYSAWFDRKYICSNKFKHCSLNLPEIITCGRDVNAWLDVMSALKQEMTLWFSSHQKAEREFQQLVVRENNGFLVGGSTDYFIIDIEYDNHEGARFDMIAVKWDSDGVSRKLSRGYLPTLTFVEMKYGDYALSGSAGMAKHIEDFKKYINGHGLQSTQKEMLKVFVQQRELELIPALINNPNVVKTFSGDVDYLFVLANHDPASRKLYEALNAVKEGYKNQDLGFGLKFCVSNFMGYGIYKENVFSLDEFIERFDKQILCR